MGDAATTPADLVEKLTDEGLLSMSAAARMYGESRPGHATHKSTVTRHALAGVRLPDGSTLRLEAVRVAGRLMTSRAAVLRFFERQQSDTTSPPTPPAPRSPAQRSKASARAAAELDKLGVPAG